MKRNKYEIPLTRTLIFPITFHASMHHFSWNKEKNEKEKCKEIILISINLLHVCSCFVYVHHGSWERCRKAAKVTLKIKLRNKIGDGKEKREREEKVMFFDKRNVIAKHICCAYVEAEKGK